MWSSREGCRCSRRLHWARWRRPAASRWRAPAGGENGPRRTAAGWSAGATDDRPVRSECDRHDRETRDGTASRPPKRTATGSSIPPVHNKHQCEGLFWLFCYHLLTLTSIQTCRTFFLQWINKRYFVKYPVIWVCPAPKMDHIAVHWNFGN